MRKLLIICAIPTLLSSCVTYQKCKEKFASDYTDTTFVTKTVELLVPRDSINYEYHNDTVFTKVIENERTILKIEKQPYNTYITCESKELIRTITLRAPCPPVPQKWGIAPWHKTVNYVLFGALIIAVICCVILFNLKRNISIFGK